MFPKQPCSFSRCDICENGIDYLVDYLVLKQENLIFLKAYLIMPLFQQTAYCLTLLHYIPMPSILISLSLKKKRLSLIILVYQSTPMSNHFSATQCFQYKLSAAKSPMRTATGPTLNVDYLMDTVLKRLVQKTAELQFIYNLDNN